MPGLKIDFNYSHEHEVDITIIISPEYYYISGYDRRNFINSEVRRYSFLDDDFSEYVTKINFLIKEVTNTICNRRMREAKNE